jgi:hypothetical protein
MVSRTPILYARFRRLYQAYNAFVRYGKSSSWCKSHALSFRTMSRAISIRTQLKKYMQRFGLPIESCEGDAKRLRRCLVSGYWRNAARWVADGTYRSVRGNKVCPNHFLSEYGISTRGARRPCMFILRLSCSPASRGLDGSSSTKWRKQKRHSEFLFLTMPRMLKWNYRIRVLTEIDADWYVLSLSGSHALKGWKPAGYWTTVTSTATSAKKRETRNNIH